MPRLLYLDYPPCSVAEIRVLRTTPTGPVVEEALVFGGSAECPSDLSDVEWRGETYLVSSAQLLRDGQHLECSISPEVGETVIVRVDRAQRQAVCQAHTALHAAQGLLSEHFSKLDISDARVVEGKGRIEIRHVDDHTRAALSAFEFWLNEKLQRDLAVRSSLMPIDQLDGMNIDTCPSMPPAAFEGQIRVVEIEGLHRQVCTGPHLALTGDCGSVRIQLQSNPGRCGGLIMTLETSAAPVGARPNVASPTKSMSAR